MVHTVRCHFCCTVTVCRSMNNFKILRLRGLLKHINIITSSLTVILCLWLNSKLKIQNVSCYRLIWLINNFLLYDNHWTPGRLIQIQVNKLRRILRLETKKAVIVRYYQLSTADSDEDDCFYNFEKQSSTLDIESICSNLAGFEISVLHMYVYHSL